MRNAIVRVVRFDSEDIIATSCGYFGTTWTQTSYKAIATRGNEKGYYVGYDPEWKCTAGNTDVYINGVKCEKDNYGYHLTPGTYYHYDTSSWCEDSGVIPGYTRWWVCQDETHRQ